MRTRGFLLLTLLAGLLSGPGYTLFLTHTQAVLVLKQPSAVSRQQAASKPPASRPLASPPIVGEDQIPSLSLFHCGERSFVPSPYRGGGEGWGGRAADAPGGCQSCSPDGGAGGTPWQGPLLPGQRPHQVADYGRVHYKNIYPGIDFIYYGTQRHLEYDFVVAPGANPTAIRLAFDGLTPSPLAGEGQDGGRSRSPLRIDTNGDLILNIEGGELRLHKPLVYQEVDGVKQPIPGHYVLNPKSEIGNLKSAIPQKLLWAVR